MSTETKYIPKSYVVAALQYVAEIARLCHANKPHIIREVTADGTVLNVITFTVPERYEHARQIHCVVGPDLEASVVAFPVTDDLEKASTETLSGLAPSKVSIYARVPQVLYAGDSNYSKYVAMESAWNIEQVLDVTRRYLSHIVAELSVLTPGGVDWNHVQKKLRRDAGCKNSKRFNWLRSFFRSFFRSWLHTEHMPPL